MRVHAARFEPVTEGEVPIGWLERGSLVDVAWLFVRTGREEGLEHRADPAHMALDAGVREGVFDPVGQQR